MNRTELNRATLARQQLLVRTARKPLQVIEDLAGMQAQAPKPPFIGLWTRMKKFAPADLAKLVHDRKAVRATLMRGTLHLCSAADYFIFRPALAEMLAASMAGVLRDRAKTFELEKITAAGKKWFEKKSSTFEALRDHLLEKFPAGDERAMGFAVRTHLPLVMVPDDSAWSFPADSDFALAARWLEKEPDAKADAKELVKKYLAAFGPATIADAQSWSGIKNLKPAFAALREQLMTFQDENRRELFDLPNSPRPNVDTPAPVRFLPEFDNLLLAHADRTRVIDDAHRKIVVTKNLRILATFLVDGRVAGTWTTEKKRGAATLELTPFIKLDKKTRAALEEEGTALLHFLESDAKSSAVTFAP